MKHYWAYILFSGLMIVNMVSCAPVPRSSLNDTRTIPSPVSPANKLPIASPTAAPMSGSSHTPQQTTIPLDPTLLPIVAQAKQDLARRLKLPIDSITVAAVIGQEFSIDAFYCKTSKDRIAGDESSLAVSGYSILLRVSARRYEYHASGQTIVFCRPVL